MNECPTHINIENEFVCYDDLVTFYENADEKSNLFFS